jgi:glycerol-3-phosphate dehydrogenase subunit C
VGRDAVSVLQKNACAVSCVAEVCCGMPYLDAGDLDSATANARKNVAALLPLVEQGAPVVVPQPTCSYVLKKEYPVLLPGDAGAQKVADATRDLFEYLALRRAEGSLATDFTGPAPGKVAYQMPQAAMPSSMRPNARSDRRPSKRTLHRPPSPLPRPRPHMKAATMIAIE